MEIDLRGMGAMLYRLFAHSFTTLLGLITSNPSSISIYK